MGKANESSSQSRRASISAQKLRLRLKLCQRLPYGASNRMTGSDYCASSPAEIVVPPTTGILSGDLRQ